MLRDSKAAGLRVEVTTNGTLLDAATAEAIVNLGIDRIVVSVDGLTEERFGDIRTNGSLAQVVENMRRLYGLKLRWKGRHADPQVGIAFVAMKRNVAEIALLPRLATRIGAQSIIVSNLVPHTPEMEREILYSHSLIATTYSGSPVLTNVSFPKLDLDSHTLEPIRSVFASAASVSLLDASLSAREDYCRFAQEGYAAVRWDGEVSPCLPLLHDHPEYVQGRRKEVTHYSLGNIGQRPLSEIWGSPEFVAFRAKQRQFPYSPCTTCGGCQWFARNREDCSGNTFPVCGGCLWAQGFVQCP